MNSQIEQYRTFFKIKEKIEKIFINSVFKSLQCLVTIVSLVLSLLIESKHYDVIMFSVLTVNLVFYSLIMTIGILFTDDFSYLFFSFMLFPLGLMKMKEIDYQTVSKFLGFFIIFFIAVIVRMYINHKIYGYRFKKGVFFYETLLLTIAITIGGLGYQNISAFKNYGCLFHYLTLGPAYIFIYLFLVNNVNVAKGKNLLEKFINDFIWIGFAVAIIVIVGHIFNIYYSFEHTYNGTTLTFNEIVKNKEILKIIFVPGRTSLTQWRNLAAQLLIFAIPSIYYKIKTKKNLRSYIIGFTICVAAVYTGSRNGLVFGALSLIYITYIAYKTYSNKTYKKITMTILIMIVLVIVGALVYISKNKVDSIIQKTIEIGDTARVKLYKEAIINFFRSPIFGVGLLYYPKNLVYDPLNLGMYWIHSNVLQVLSSFGIFGVIVYGYFIFRRFKIFARAKQIYSKMAILMYVLMLGLGLLDIVGFLLFPTNFMILFFAAFIENENKKNGYIEKLYGDEIFKFKFKNPNNYFDK